MTKVYSKYRGFIKNTKSYSTTYGKRIPDFINKRVIGEIKNVKYQSLTRQIRGFVELAKDANKQFVLVVNKGTVLSKPLLAEIERIGGKVLRFGANDLNIAFSLMPWDVYKIIIENSLYYKKQDIVT